MQSKAVIAIAQKRKDTAPDNFEHLAKRSRRG